MFISGKTKKIFSEFIFSQTLNKKEILNPPFAYVDKEEGTIKLVTKVFNSYGEKPEVYALSQNDEGELQYLATES